MDKLKNMKKTTKNNIITYALVIAAFVIMQSLINAGSISSLLEGLMVPLCIYIIMAVSLNLVVGVLGELSLGHAGFMCVGAFASAFFSKCMRDTIESASLRFFLALLIGIAAAADLRHSDRNSGSASERRLSGDRDIGIRRDH